MKIARLVCHPKRRSLAPATPTVIARSPSRSLRTGSSDEAISPKRFPCEIATPRQVGARNDSSRGLRYAFLATNSLRRRADTEVGPYVFLCRGGRLCPPFCRSIHSSLTLNTLALLKWAERRLGSGGVPSPRLDAEILLEHTLKTPRVQLLIDPERILSYKEAQLYRELVEKRAERIPLQYIMGEAAFRYLVLKVTPDVLIPRAETELVAGEVIKIVRKLKEPRILDIGTGSGAIALSVAYEVENASVVATDVSEKALDVARENVRKYNLEDRVTFILSDLFKNLPILLKGHFDVIVSNPPYVSRGDLAQLAPEVGQHEPRVALTGDLNEDPLYYHRIIAREALEFLKAGGYLVLEIGAEQGREMTEILRQTGYGEVEIVKDLQGCDRIAKGKRI